MQGIHKMQDKEFLAFLNTTASKGGAVFNIKTSNVSKQARDILASTQYKMLAKQHINSNVIQAYKNNTLFKQKLEQVMQEYNITIVA